MEEQDFWDDEGKVLNYINRLKAEIMKDQDDKRAIELKQGKNNHSSDDEPPKGVLDEDTAFREAEERTFKFDFNTEVCNHEFITRASRKEYKKLSRAKICKDLMNWIKKDC